MEIQVGFGMENPSAANQGDPARIFSEVDSYAKRWEEVVKAGVEGERGHSRDP